MFLCCLDAHPPGPMLCCFIIAWKCICRTTAFSSCGRFFALVIFTRRFSFCMEIASCKQYVNFQHIPLFCWIPDKKHGCNGCSNTILQRFLADQGAYRKGSFPLRRLDGVVSNAGIGMGRSPLHEYDEEDYERIFNLNSKGVLPV